MDKLSIINDELNNEELNTIAGGASINGCLMGTVSTDNGNGVALDVANSSTDIGTFSCANKDDQAVWEKYQGSCSMTIDTNAGTMTMNDGTVIKGTYTPCSTIPCST